MSITLITGGKLNTLAVDTNVFSGANQIARKVSSNSNVEFGDYAVERTLYIHPTKTSSLKLVVSGIIVTTDIPVVVSIGNAEITVNKLFVYYGKIDTIDFTNLSTDSQATVRIAYVAEPSQLTYCHLTASMPFGSPFTIVCGSVPYTVPSAPMLAPVASFTADVQHGPVSLTVTFTDTSSNNPTSWLWFFGDESSSTEQNPVHVYSSIGLFNVSLTATNAAGNDTHVENKCISATSPYWASRTWFPTNTISCYIDGGCVTPDGGAIAVGSSDSGNDTRMNVVRLDGSGNPLWHAVLGDADTDNQIHGEFAVLDMDNNATTFATYYDPNSGMGSVAVVVLGRDTGALVWQYQLQSFVYTVVDSPAVPTDMTLVQALAMPDGMLVMGVANNVDGSGTPAVTLTKLDSGGNIVWSPSFAQYSGTFSVGGGIVHDGSNNIFMLMLSSSFYVTVLRISNTDGSVVWSQRIYGFNTGEASYGCITTASTGFSELWMVVGQYIVQMTRGGALASIRRMDGAGTGVKSLTMTSDASALMLTYFGVDSNEPYLLTKLSLAANPNTMDYAYSMFTSQGAIFNWYYNTYANALEISTSGNEVLVFSTAVNGDGGIVVKLPIDFSVSPGGFTNSNADLTIEETTPNALTNVMSSGFYATQDSLFNGGTVDVRQQITGLSYELVTNFDHTEGPLDPYTAPPPQVPEAHFSCYNNAGHAPLVVHFTDQSTGRPTSWTWDFGDGNTDSSRNPIHTYTTSGVYDVTLAATNASGSSSTTIQGIVIVTSVPSAPISVVAVIE